MGSTHENNKPHVVCIPAPAQGHITPMLKLAKILHTKGFFITFINTEFNHQRLLRSLGSNALPDHRSFHFDTIPDGLPPPNNPNATQDGSSVLNSIHEMGLRPFKNVITKVSGLYSPVTCIVTDFLMGFTLPVAEELGVLVIMFWTAGAGSLICYDQFPNLIQKGLMPLKERRLVQRPMTEALRGAKTEIETLPLTPIGVFRRHWVPTLLHTQ